MHTHIRMLLHHPLHFTSHVTSTRILQYLQPPQGPSVVTWGQSPWLLLSMAAPTPTLRAAILSYSQELVADASAHFFFWSQDIYTNCLLQLRILVGGGSPSAGSVSLGKGLSSEGIKTPPPNISVLNDLGREAVLSLL